MAKKENNRIIVSLIWNGVASAINLAINMIITPVVTRKMGTEAYGYVSLANNFVTYVTVLTTALNSYATRYISLEYHQKNKASTKRYFNSVLFANLFSGFIVFVILLGITFKLENIIVIPAILVGDVKMLFLFMFLNFYVLLLANTFLASCYIKDRLDLLGIFKSLGYVITIAFILLAFRYLKAHIWYVGLGYLLCSLIVLCSAWFIYKKFTPDISIKIKAYSFKAVKKLVLEGVWNSINSLGNLLNSGLDLIITNLMLSPLIMGQLSIAKTIGNIQCVLYQIVSQAFQPQFLKVYASGNQKEILSLFKRAMKLSGFIAGTFFIGFFVLGKEFYFLWIPNQDINYIYNLTVITLLSYMLEGIVGPLYYIYTLTVKNKIPCIITIIGGVINIGTKYIFLTQTHLGGYSVVITTAVIMMLINLISNPIYMTKCLGVKWYEFYPTILRFLCYIIISTSICDLLVKNLLEANWINLITNGIFVLILCTIFYSIIVLSKEERMIILSNLRRKK